MKKLFILFSIALMSCRHGVQFNIHNTTDDVIDYVDIKTSDFASEIRLTNIPPGKTQSTYLDMRKTKKDGHYVLKSSSGDVGKMVDFGYYTNGVPQNDTIDVFMNNLNISFVLGEP